MSKQGKVFRTKHAVPLPVNLEEIKKPPQNPLTATKIFCSGCGEVYEIDLERARQIVPLPADKYREIFFIADHCNINCHEGEKEIKFKTEKVLID